MDAPSNRTDTVSPPPDFEDDGRHSRLLPINYLHCLPLCHSQSQSTENQPVPGELQIMLPSASEATRNRSNSKRARHFRELKVVIQDRAAK
jgi:hypothetical protein